MSRSLISPRRSSHRAFTVVELLVIVAIICLLISITLPALARHKENARRILCGNQLRQWGIMCTEYSDDNVEKFPALGGSTIEVFQYDTALTRKLMEPYGLLIEMAYCTDGFVPLSQQETLFNTPGPQFWGYSYFPGRETRDGLDNGYVPYSKLQPRVRGMPDDWVLIADINTGHNAAAWTPWRPWAISHANHPNPRRPEGKHLYTSEQMYIPYGVNNCYFDTHVRWINFDALNLAKKYVHSHWKYNFHWD